MAAVTRRPRTGAARRHSKAPRRKSDPPVVQQQPAVSSASARSLSAAEDISNSNDQKLNHQVSVNIVQQISRVGSDAHAQAQTSEIQVTLSTIQQNGQSQEANVNATVETNTNICKQEPLDEGVPDCLDEQDEDDLIKTVESFINDIDSDILNDFNSFSDLVQSENFVKEEKAFAASVASSASAACSSSILQSPDSCSVQSTAFASSTVSSAAIDSKNCTFPQPTFARQPATRAPASNSTKMFAEPTIYDGSHPGVAGYQQGPSPGAPPTTPGAYPSGGGTTPRTTPGPDVPSVLEGPAANTLKQLAAQHQNGPESPATPQQHFAMKPPGAPSFQGYNTNGMRATSPGNYDSYSSYQGPSPPAMPSNPGSMAPAMGHSPTGMGPANPAQGIGPSGQSYPPYPGATYGPSAKEMNSYNTKPLSHYSTDSSGVGGAAAMPPAMNKPPTPSSLQQLQNQVHTHFSQAPPGAQTPHMKMASPGVQHMHITQSQHMQMSSHGGQGLHMSQTQQLQIHSNSSGQQQISAVQHQNGMNLPPQGQHYMSEQQRQTYTNRPPPEYSKQAYQRPLAPSQQHQPNPLQTMQNMVNQTPPPPPQHIQQAAQQHQQAPNGPPPPGGYQMRPCMPPGFPGAARPMMNQGPDGTAIKQEHPQFTSTLMRGHRAPNVNVGPGGMNLAHSRAMGGWGGGGPPMRAGQPEHMTSQQYGAPHYSQQQVMMQGSGAARMLSAQQMGVRPTAPHQAFSQQQHQQSHQHMAMAQQQQMMTMSNPRCPRMTSHMAMAQAMSGSCHPQSMPPPQMATHPQQTPQMHSPQPMHPPQAHGTPGMSAPARPPAPPQANATAAAGQQGYLENFIDESLSQPQPGGTNNELNFLDEILGK